MKKLPLNNFYAILDNNTDYVIAENNICNGYVSTSYPNANEFHELCRRLVYKLKNFSGIKAQCTNIQKEKFCDYLNYWLGNQIININPKSNNIKLIGNLFDVISTTFVEEKCTCKTDKFSNHSFTKMKEFFDYTENIEGINNLNESLKTLRGGYYCNYILKAVKSYNEIIEKDSCPDNSCEYYAELENFRTKFFHLLTSLKSKCPNDINISCIRITKEKYHESCTTLKHTYGDSQNASPNDQHTGDSNSVVKIVTSVCVLSGLFFLSSILYKVNKNSFFINMNFLL